MSGPVSTWMGDQLWVNHLCILASYLGQLSLPSLWGRLIKYQLDWLGLRRGVFTCIRWQVTLWVLTAGDIFVYFIYLSRSSEVGFQWRPIHSFDLFKLVRVRLTISAAHKMCLIQECASTMTHILTNKLI